MAPKFKDGDTVFSFNGKWISWSHTIVGYTAFLGALVVGIWLHYHKIVQNEHYGYPDEWFPSVSATIGDRYPERSVFQIFIAITSGPRFALVLLWYILTARPNSVLPKAVLGVGIFRTLTCGGWTYVTSTDDHDWHDIFMIAYLVATLPWTLGCLALSPPNPRALKYRRMFAGLFFATLVPLVYFFIQHKVHKIPGAYTTYAFFEWALILFDVAFDAVTALDFEGFEITVKDIKGISRGTSKSDAAVEKKRSQPGRLETRVTAWTVGLLASSLMKYACHTNNPAWPIVNEKNGGWNKTVLVLALIAMLRPSRRNYVSGDYMTSSNGRKGSSILSALGFGGLTFAMHSLLSDSSTMILWVWEGFPVRGPIAVPHGSLTLLAMAAGVYLGVTYPRLAGSWTAFGLGSVGAALLTGNSHWLGFYGGLMLAVYVMAVAPVLISSGVKHSPATVFGLGFFVYNFMVLFHVWIVAYAFVPGGPLVRERTDWVMTSTMLLIGAGVFSSSVSQTTSSAKYRKPVVNARKQRTYYFYVLGALQIFSFAVGFMRFPTNDYTPYHKDEKIMTAGIWTVHFSLDNDMWSSERRMRDAIKELELDVVGLLESDLQRIIMGNRDTTQFLAEDLGMYVDYGPGPNKHTWGCALLSKFPILNSTHHLLPSPVGELAPAIHATLDMYGEQVDVVVFHSGQEEDPEDRRLQSEYLSKLMGSSNRPMILLSYLVTKPLEGNYNTYVSEQSGMKDIDSTDWDRWCEYILYKNIRKIGYARVSRGTITDTELQVGKFAVGQPEGKGERISEDQVPVGMRFPAMFRGEGVRGHRYHVFDEPRYYN
ncbi:calcofluor white hypersensitive protein [Trichophyton equinum CBS 127.97]|uniref:Calcofluor white hypersensitive protein n=1 Tax=Trichophyton equinum (strain ATCC MYA-4606 / CBS 127.97) TaxID=559882 RepID=F2PJ26_TRIEC|nr:calcofluor white hypersensitive protein [Trichophyton equinum CBS 127.97]